ncbi:MAG: 2OG-Fe(II) oxygenase [Sphingomonas sp.]|uniref:2OG-Fe(II) oxygenase n=1 Tax=Sphingomonas sp. TaxID=28214 RepID=UPI0025E9E191|nr:2OG-Fe(II) oxygenase family protein [Sphingomonas sp.]MBY0282861.1 2OG-Fe(II) oxygenase [Sphingomonas sp.]
MPKALFTINPALDRDALAARFAADRRVQIRDVLTDEAARNLRDVIATATPWGLGWQAGADGPHGVTAAELARIDQRRRAEMNGGIIRAMQGSDYGFSYARYPILDAYLQRWAPGGAHDLLLEHLNDQPFLDLVRSVTAIPELLKADAQATLFAPGHFLARHDDSHVGEGWRVAYVLSLCATDWRPDWGGYLLFYDADGDVVAGYRPRFNALSLFAVPASHAVTFVPPFAPVARYSITGWLRDR